MEITRVEKRQRSESEWQELYDEHMGLGISMNSFCKSKGIAISSYIKWHQRFKNGGEVVPKFKSLKREEEFSEEEVKVKNKIELELDIGSGIILRISK